MAGVHYGITVRMSDWYQGWRDGRRAIPRPGSRTTPHRDVIVRWAHEAFEHERLRHEAAWADDLTELVRLTALRSHLLATLRQAERQLAQAAVPLSEDQVTARRPGEEQRTETLIRLRRGREHTRRLASAARRARAAEAELDRLDAEVEARQDAIARQVRVTGIRVGRVHQHAHRRIATYLRRLVRSHPDGARVSQGMDVLEPYLPEWVRDDAVTPVPPPATPPATAPTPSGPTTRTFPLLDHLTIGSDADSDIVITGYHVARRHAVVERHHDRIELRDLGHADGTFQRGQPVRRTRLVAGSVFDIADHRFHVNAECTELVVVPLGACDLVVHELCALGRVGAELRPRLTTMSFVQRERTVLAILGPSGAGKSSLFSALLGELATTGGSLFFRGMDVAGHRKQIRSHLGFVPQDDSVHRALTVRQLLRFGDRLRRPSDRAADHHDPVVEVCRQLDIEKCLDQTVAQLSGGQRKRVSIALELITKPRLLMLDEPTSGLDPGMDRDVMASLRAIAAADCTVVVVTHATEHLYLADQVLVVASQGRAVYCGPPSGLLDAVGVPTYADLMKALEQPEELAAAYNAGPAAELAGRMAREIAHREPDQEPPEQLRGSLTALLHQLPVLVARQTVLTFPVLVTRRTTAVLATTMPFLIAVLSAVIAGVVTGAEGLGAGPSRSGPTALSILVTLCVLTGQALSYSNLVEEHAVIVREHRTGMVPAGVVLAKWSVFTVVAIAQAALATTVFLLLRPGPVHSVTALSPAVELFVGLAATSVAAMSLGLLISAACRELKQAVTLTSLTVVAQVALNGVTTDLSDSRTVNAVAVLLPARWGLAVSASGVNLPTITAPPPHDLLWIHSQEQWLTNLGVLAVLTVVFGALAAVVLARRLRPAR